MRRHHELPCAALAALCLTGCLPGLQPGKPEARSGDDRAPKAEAPAHPAIQPLADDEVGYYVDVLEARLRQRMGGTGLTLERADTRLTIRLAGGMSFEAGSARLSDRIREPLSALAEVLVEFDRSRVRLTGHTDDSGPADFNLELSRQRATAIARHLRNAGVARARIEVIGKGETAPVGDNATESGRALNRRVELVIEPIRH